MRKLRGARIALAASAVAVAATGCTTMKKVQDKTYNTFRSALTSSYHDDRAEEKVAEAEELFKAGEFEKAAPIFGDIADNTYNPVLMAEKARYMQAECFRQRGRTVDAITHYNRMLQDFPAGAYREKGCEQIYTVAYGWLEEDTLKEVEAELAGRSKPWWQKAPKLPNPFDKTRPMMDQEGEALKYLETAHTHDIMGPSADKALFWCGYVNFYRGRYDEADHFFSQLVEMHKDSPLWSEAVKLAVISKNNSTGGAVYDTQKAAEALQLVHHAEATVPDYVTDKEKAAWLTRQKMAIRMQLAEKDLETARYYERTNHLPSAYFYYELVTRRYPGTKYSDMAKDRLGHLEGVKAQIAADKAAGRMGTWETIESGVLSVLRTVDPNSVPPAPAEMVRIDAAPTAPTPTPKEAKVAPASGTSIPGDNR
jgi:TolA-binding protein